jgi:hypothetical protein
MSELTKPELTNEQAERIAESWRTGFQSVEGWDSPAGPLFASGAYAESDITMEAIFAATGCPPPQTPGCPPQSCGTACTGSAPRQCC